MDVDFTELDDWLGTLENLQTSLSTSGKETTAQHSKSQIGTNTSQEPTIIVKRDKSDLSNQHAIQSIRLSFNDVHKKNPGTGEDLENLLNELTLGKNSSPQKHPCSSQHQTENGVTFHSTASIDSGIHDARLSPKFAYSSSNKGSPLSNASGYTEQGFVLPPYPQTMPPIETVPFVPVGDSGRPFYNFPGANYTRGPAPLERNQHSLNVLVETETKVDHFHQLPSPPTASRNIHMPSSAASPPDNYSVHVPSFNHSISLPHDFTGESLSPVMHNSQVVLSPNTHQSKEVLYSPALSLKNTLESKQQEVTPLKTDLLSQRRMQINTELPIHSAGSDMYGPVQVSANAVKFGMYSPVPGVHLQRNSFGTVNNSWQNSMEKVDEPDSQNFREKIVMNLKDRACYSPDFIGSTSTEDPDLDIDESSEINYKIDKVLDTARKMDLKKIVVRVFHQNKTTKAILIDEETTVAEACKMLIEKNFCLPKERLTLVEKVPNLKMERFFEDHELLADCILSWPEQSRNMIFFEERPDKYGLFEDPVKWIGEAYPCTKGPLDQAAIQDIFGGSEPTLPDWKDYLYIKKPGEKAWTRSFCIVRNSGLYASKKKKSTTPNDLLRIMVFDKNFHIYTTTGGWTKLKAPTPHGFAYKPYSAQDKSSKNILYFCASDENAMRRWCASLRIACYGQQLLLNYETAMIRCGREVSPEVSTLSRRSRETNRNMMASSRKGSLDILQSSMGSMSSVLSGLSSPRSSTVDRQYSRNRHNSLTKSSPFSPLISHLSRPFGGSKSSIVSQPTK